MKVKIYTFPDKAPKFIGWQDELLKRHIKDDYEFIVMNNSSSAGLDIQIRSICSERKIHIEKVLKKDFSTGCYACAYPIQWCIDSFIREDKENISVILDSDIFPMGDFSFEEYLGGNDIAAVPQGREGGYKFIEYLWNGIMIISPLAPDIHTLDMGCGMIWKAPVDVGGMSYYYLINHPNLKWKKINSTGLIIDHPDILCLLPENIRGDYKIEFDMEILAYSLLHFRGGSRWDNRPKKYYEEKERFIEKLMYGK